MISEPAEARREEAVHGSGVCSDGHRGVYLKIPLCVQAVSMSPVLAYAKVNLRRKERNVCVSRSGWAAVCGLSWLYLILLPECFN